LEGQSVQKSFIYANIKNGGLGFPNMEDQYAAYKVNHVAKLMSTEEGRRILVVCINLREKMAVNQNLIHSLEAACNQLGIDWPDWTRFKREGKTFEWDKNERNGKHQFNFIDKATNHQYKGNVESIHKSLIVHARMEYDYEKFSRFNTRGLIN
jgi:hypothetical protein